MPFTAKGLRPDLILNPHAMPSRMTTGQMFESVSARIGLALGTLIDATPFCTRSQDEDYRQMMRKIGLEQNGSEMFYNGMTGEMMEMEIFVGPTYYLRSKLMVERLQASSCEPEVRKISSVVEAMVESDASTGRTPRAVAIRIMQLVMVGS
jgi:DNA-directed RNA polymerase beta subunit